ncbi:hypothetical protein ILUMI_24931 [Ignelater luminosus]|uniref:Dipeptidase n=1 Tax=Ignelater luminosus TaxID=2038154 RepID=A0A8K0G060_IGNLU|nr:hypothetical protein ILUMI_24931 [Ignelater luminosus]
MKLDAGLFLILCITLLSSTTRSHVLDEAPLIDGHNDLPYNLYKLTENNLDKYNFEKNLTNDPVWGSKYCKSCFTDLPRLRAGKVAAQFWVAYVDCKVQYKDALAKTIEQIDVIKRFAKRYQNYLHLATSTADITNAFASGKIASLIGVEGGHSMDSRLGVLRMLYDLGARYMTLTHACNTPWADNSYVDDSKPVHNLTAFGRLVVREMNRLGMLVDLSHVSHNVMNQAIDASVAPIFFSHSSAYAVRNHNRNVQDSTLRKVKENRGVVMVNFASNFVNSDPLQASIEDVAKHINHIVNVAGINSVGIGADYDGVSSMPKGLEDVSKYPDLFDLLQAQNASRWTNENLKLLAGGNFLRVFQEVENVCSEYTTSMFK